VKFDREGNRAARSDIAMCKVYNAQVVAHVRRPCAAGARVAGLQLRHAVGNTGSADGHPGRRRQRSAQGHIAKSELAAIRPSKAGPASMVPTRLEWRANRFAHLLEAAPLTLAHPASMFRDSGPRDHTGRGGGVTDPRR